MEVFPFYPDGYFGSVCYVLYNCGKYVVIDPSVDLVIICEKIPDFFPSYIILTHAHFDHMLFLENFVNKYSSVPVLLHESDKQGLQSPHYNASILFLRNPLVYHGQARTVRDGDSISFGDSALNIYNFSGHTEGSVVIQCGKNLFSGDLIFDGGNLGRVDLISGDFDKMTHSINRFFKLFLDDYTIFPGHGNPFMLNNIRHQFK